MTQIHFADFLERFEVQLVVSFIVVLLYFSSRKITAGLVKNTA